MKKLRILILFALFAFGSALIIGNNSKAAVKLSAKKVTFKKPSTGTKTITIKGVKASKIKKMTVTSSDPLIAKVKKKSKTKFVISAGYSGETYVSVVAMYKKPIKGEYSFIKSVKVKVKGTTKIPIKKAKDLTQMQEYHTDWTYVLKNDIDMSGVSLPLKNKWGSNIAINNTTLDGNGHAIKNLNGPFLSCLAGTLKNVKFENFKIECKNTDKTDLRDAISKGSAAALIQYTSGATIKNCKVSGSIKLTFEGDDNFDSSDSGRIYYLEYVGGLVGRNQSFSYSIEKCVSDVDITLDYRDSSNASRRVYVGGICGQNDGSDSNINPIKECANLGDIVTYSGSCFVGGIAGYSSRAIYENCLNTGSIYNHDYYTHEKTDRYEFYGGLVGTDGSSSSWKNCLNNGEVGYGLNGSSVSEAYPNLPAYDNVYNNADKTVYMFNYLPDPFDVSGAHNVSGSDLTSQAAFAGFDFDKIWKMGTNGPELQNVYQ